MSRSALGVSIETLYRRMVQQTPQRFGYSTRPRRQSVAAWQRRLRRKLLDLLAIEGRSRPAPPVRFVERTACAGYVRRRGYMLAQDGLAVPFYLLEPDPKPVRMGICLAAHGHGPGKVLPVGIAPDENARKLIEEGQRDYAVQAVRRGYLALSPDWRGFGELMLQQDVGEKLGHSCAQLACRAMQLGRPLLGQRVSDAMQLLDWALARSDADPRRVVITGNSGGGTMTLFTAAVDARITGAAPSCYFSTFADSILAMHHCPCNFVPGLQPVAEMSDLAGLFAPRPMLIIAGTQDLIFPIDAVRRGFADVQRIYADAGAPDNVELYEGAGGHRYYSWRVWDFFDEKLPRPPRGVTRRVPQPRRVPRAPGYVGGEAR